MSKKNENKTNDNASNKEETLEIPKIFTQNYHVFLSKGVFSKKENFSLKSKATKIIQHLLGILQTEPEYIQKRDINWLSAMLTHLLRSSDVGYFGYDDRTSLTSKLAFKDIQANDIGRYLEKWIFSFFDVNHHPLLPHFALATSEFIFKHLFNYMNYNSPGNKWKIEPMINGDGLTQTSFYFLDSSTFKKTFTENMKRTMAVCQIPAGYSLSTSINKKEVFTFESPFLLYLKRCFLSSSVYGWIDTHIENPNKPMFDILANFMLPGTIINPDDLPSTSHGYDTEIPGNWLIGALDYNKKINYLPDWLNITSPINA